ncbi:MAG: sugar phosphate isomerase/epimerase [Planctomycetes bacterium]|nr:sugar phosphate isomerase/epimerase [Planctomycetota bacterium]
MFRLAYNTNGLAHHRVVDALRLVAGLGYEGLSITPDVGQLDPYQLRGEDVRQTRRVASELGLELSIETGARYVLDPARKHWPNLLSPNAAERERRLDFLRRCIDLAAALDARVVALWAGTAEGGACGDAKRDDAAGDRGCMAEWDRLCAGVETLLDHARGSGIRLAFEPEPGMFIERPAGYAELKRRLGGRGAGLGLCLDVGHCLCTGDLPVSRVIAAHAGELLHVHLDDIRSGRHEHLMFGEGELDLADALDALLQTNYTGLAAVELSRDSHRGAEAARIAIERLRAALGSRARGGSI